ncbi:MAG: DNA (cytosine-5-)-methyltransferase [Spirochaetaceae bacterium]|nr:DNA (cytosine-5-)-methyltransferase [Spirochaetaceae bacterium]
MCKKTVCELFAGVGGFRLGLEKSSPDWKTVWFSQWEPGKKKQWAHDCYVKHFGDIDDFTGIDIALVDKSKIPEHNLLVGGFPCQDYSVAHSLNGEKGIEGKKGVLWWQIYDVLISKNPPFVLLENVDRLLKSPSKQRGRDFGIILACFASLGYSVEWRVINAAEYGAAQRRRRVFIFACSNKTKYANKLGKKNAVEIISSKGFFSKTFPIVNSGHINSYKIDISDLAKLSDTFCFPFKDSGVMKDGEIFTAVVESVKEPAIPLGELIEKNVSEEFFLTTSLDKFKYLKGAKRVERTAKTGFKYIFSEGAVAFPDKLDLPARTMLTSEATVNRSTHVIEDPTTKRLRLLTPLEAERIQGFDDNWTDTGMPQKFRYFCMGNALVVPLITRMGNELNKIFEEEK